MKKVFWHSSSCTFFSSSIEIDILSCVNMQFFFIREENFTVFSVYFFLMIKWCADINGARWIVLARSLSASKMVHFCNFRSVSHMLLHIIICDRCLWAIQIHISMFRSIETEIWQFEDWIIDIIFQNFR